MPARITREIVNLGVLNSSDMICYPYKVTLGQQIWALNQGATDLVMYNSCGLCRMKHYWQLQELALSQLGYQFTMHVFTKKNMVKMIREMGKVSWLKAYKILREMLAKMREVEQNHWGFRPERKLKVGIVGEVFTCWESDINFDIVRKLQRSGVNAHVSISATDYMNERTERDREAVREAKSLLTQELGGHGFQSIVNTIHYAKRGYDGVIHLMPLSCLPESTVETIVDYMAGKYNIPLYRFAFDESNFEKGFMTRLETFISMLKRR